MRYEPKIGEDFALSKEVIDAKTRFLKEATRSTIALSIIGVVLIVLLAVAAFCWYRDDYQLLQTLWNVISVPLGCIICHYFQGTPTNDQKDNASTA